MYLEHLENESSDHILVLGIASNHASVACIQDLSSQLLHLHASSPQRDGQFSNRDCN
jgi:hypothetical protein